MDQNYEDWDDSNSVTSYYVTPPTSPIIQPVNNADETKNFFQNNVNINLSSLSDLMAEQISLWCDSSSTSQQPNQLNKDNDILISLNDDDYSTANVNDDKLIFDNRINNNKTNNIGDSIDDMIKSVIIDDTVSHQDEVRHNVDSVYTQPTNLKNLPTISTISLTSLEYLTSLNTSKPTTSSETLSSSSSSTTTTSIQPQIVSKVDISQCHFSYMNDSHQTIIYASYQGDLAFLYKVGGDLNLNGGGEISCCLNGMSDEISIPFDQLCGFKITSEKKIFIKFKPNFKRT
ncbi:9615_t:CDS:2, partial [Dentiscutata heterogama]